MMLAIRSERVIVMSPDNGEAATGWPSGWGQPFVDLGIRVAFLCKEFILWRNF